jgi:hypothetical protein
MLKPILGFVIFCVVLFIYLHIMFQFKTSDDLEIYDVEDCSKEKIEEIMDIRQPVLFSHKNPKLLNIYNSTLFNKHYGSYDVKIRKSLEDDDTYVPLPLKVTNKLFDQDKSSSYFSEKNSDFLQETGITKQIKLNDMFLRPSFIFNSYYDLLF